MNWEAIGAVGEVMGAIAVVVSLLYVAVQIRQNTKIVAANTIQAVSTASSDITMRLAESSELSELLTKMFSEPENLTPKESMRMELILRAAFRNYENYYYQHKRGYLEDDMWTGYRHTMLTQVAGPFGEAWWKTHQVAFGKSFVDFVNSNIKQFDRQDSPWGRVGVGAEVNDE